MQTLLKPGLLSRAKLLVVAALIVPFLAACVTSKNPLSWTKVADDRILGSWIAEENPKNIMRLNITRRSDGNYDIAQTESNEGNPKTSQYIAFLNKGTRANYINLVLESKGKPPQYMIFEYSVSDQQLKVKSMSFTGVRSVINNHHSGHSLNGLVSEGSIGGDITLSSSSQQLFSIVEGSDGATMFDNELVFERSSLADKINAVLEKQAAAWNAGDLDAFMSAYVKSPKTTYVSADGQVTGYDALAERYRKKYGSNKESMGRLSFSGLDIQSIGSSNAFAVGRWNLVRKDQPELNGIFTLVLNREDDGWKIIHDHTSVLAEKK